MKKQVEKQTKAGARAGGSGGRPGAMTRMDDYYMCSSRHYKQRMEVKGYFVYMDKKRRNLIIDFLDCIQEEAYEGRWEGRER